VAPNGHGVLQGAQCFRCGGVPVPLDAYWIGRASLVTGESAGLLCVSCADLLREVPGVRVPVVPVPPSSALVGEGFGGLSLERGRGLMLGLLLGDALAHEPQVGDQRLMSSSAGQLACFTVEGLIRAHVRFSKIGACHPPSMVWNAYQRWADGQGLSSSHSTDSGQPWLDGWLLQQYPLRQRRGNAPATVAALTGRVMGTADQPVNQSAGHHALSTALPVAMFDLNVNRTALEVAALTHGNGAAQQAAGIAATLLVEVQRARQVASLDLDALTPPDGPSGTAPDALRQAVIAVQAHGQPEAFLDALAAAHSSGGRGAATLAGALLGACHGVSALPQELVGRLELGIIGDTLARDALTEQTQSPFETWHHRSQDLSWWHRYPG